MFITDFNTCMQGDASLKAYADGGLRFVAVPKDFDRKKNWIVYNYSSDGEDDLGEFVIHYTIEIQIISPDSEKLLLMAERVNSYLTSYDDGKIRGIYLTDDNTDYSSEFQTYYNTQSYKCIYSS